VQVLGWGRFAVYIYPAFVFQAQTLSLRGQNCSQAATGAGALCDCGSEGAAGANGSAGALLASRLSAGTMDKVISTLPAVSSWRHHTEECRGAGLALFCSRKHLQALVAQTSILDQG